MRLNARNNSFSNTIRTSDMLGLPQSTEVKRPLPKAQLYKGGATGNHRNVKVSIAMCRLLTSLAGLHRAHSPPSPRVLRLRRYLLLKSRSKAATSTLKISSFSPRYSAARNLHSSLRERGYACCLSPQAFHRSVATD